MWVPLFASQQFRLFKRWPVERLLKPKDFIVVQPNELDHICCRIVAHIQQAIFPDDISALEKGKLVHPSLQKLTPFLYKTEVGHGFVTLIRVGGRLSNAPIPYDARFPALLHKKQTPYHKKYWPIASHFRRVADSYHRNRGHFKFSPIAPNRVTC